MAMARVMASLSEMEAPVGAEVVDCAGVMGAPKMSGGVVAGADCWGWGPLGGVAGAIEGVLAGAPRAGAGWGC